MCVTPNRVYLVEVNHDLGLVRFMRPDCHLWACEECAEVNKRRWTAIVAEGIKSYQAEGLTQWRFVTVTSHEALSSFNQTLYVWKRAYPKLYARLKRKQPDIKYVFLPEKHKDGRLHFHALISHPIETRWWKDNARSCGLGYKAESVEPLSIAKACFYVLKYITKSLQAGSSWPKHFHRVRVSRNWPKLPEGELPVEQQGLYSRVAATEWREKVEAWREAEYRIIDVRTGEIL